MIVLLTGGSGFIGTYTVDALIDAGHEVLLFDRHDKATASNRDVKFFLGDVTDANAVTEAMAHADSWIHLAGVLGTQETINNPSPAVMTNVIGGLNVFKAAAQYKVPGVNIAVGNYWMNNTYSITKSTMERFVNMFNTELGTQISIVRALNAYGPGQLSASPYGPSKVRKIMPAFVNSAIRQEPITIYGDGQQVMDMIYVEDVARILVLALEKTVRDGASPSVYEAGSGRATTVNDIAKIVWETANPKAPHQFNYVPMRPGEPNSSIVLGNPNTLAPLGVSGYELVDLNYGVAKTVDYYRLLRDEARNS